MSQTIDLQVFGANFNRLVEAARGGLSYVIDHVETRGHGCIGLALREVVMAPDPFLVWVKGGLPPVGSRVNYTPLGATRGCEVNILAHFDTGVAEVATYVPVNGVRKVNQATAACFSMIKTPDEIAAEVREFKAKQLYLSLYYREPEDVWEAKSDDQKETFRRAIDEGWHKS